MVNDDRLPPHPDQPIRRRCRPMAGHEIGLGQADVAADHVERRVAEDLLEAEHVAAVDEIPPSKRMAEGVRGCSGSRSPPVARGGRSRAGCRGRSGPGPSARRERIAGDDGCPSREVADERPPSARTDRHDPLLGALAHDMERTVGTDVTDPQTKEFLSCKKNVGPFFKIGRAHV